MGRMGRKPQVRFYASRNGYHCTLNGKLHKLGDGPDDSPNGERYLAAVKAYSELMATGNIEIAGNSNSVATICNAYLSHVEGSKRASTYKLRVMALRPFVEECGSLRVSQVKPFHLEAVISKMRHPRKVKGYHKLMTWSDGTIRIFVVSVKAAFAWGLEQGLLEKVPMLKAVKSPMSKTKARDRIITNEDHEVILAKLMTKRTQNLRRLVVALENSGARPGELINSTGGDWNEELGAIVYYGDDSRREDEFAHKTSGKGKDRTIRFTGEALNMVRTLVATKKPKDLLFPTTAGTSYGKNLYHRFREEIGRASCRERV